MDIADLNLDTRTFNAVCRAGFKTAEELFQAMGENQECVRLLIGRNNFERIDEAFAELEDKGMLEFTTKLPPATAETTTPEYLAAFNLNARIHYCKDSVERGLAEMCIGIEQMHAEKQYKQLGYANFEDYCQQEFGFTKQQGIKYVSVGKMLAEQNDNSSCRFEEIGINKLHLLAKLDEPTREAVTETVDVESVTVRELRNEINRITSENADLGQKLDAAQETIANKDRQFRAAMDSKNRELECVNESKKHSDEIYKKKHAEWVRAQNENAALTAKISDLEDQIKELENRPVEVAVSVEEVEEIERLNAELNEAKQELEQAKNEANRLASEAIRNMRGCHESEMEALRNQYERDLEKARKLAPDASELNKACFDSFRKMFEDLVDEIEIFLEDLHDDPRIAYVNRLDDYWTKNLLYLKRKGEGAGA